VISASPALIPLLVRLHGIGGRQDLPLPFGYLLTGSAVAVALSFLVLGLAWKTPRYRGADAGIPLPSAISQAVNCPALRWAVRGMGLLVFFFMAAALYFGKDLLTNPIFGFIYVWVWVGLVPISLLFGPVWRTLNPLRTLHLLGCRLIQVNPDRGLLRLPGWIGIWSATLGLFAFVWLELVAPYRVTTPVVLLWADLYVVAGLLGAIFFGQRFGTAELAPNLSFINYPALIALAQVGAVVCGHLLGVISAHDRALALFPRRTAVAGQIPLMAVMVGYTVAGLLLLFSV
jgi:hypothetical protein